MSPPNRMSTQSLLLGVGRNQVINLKYLPVLSTSRDEEFGYRTPTLTAIKLKVPLVQATELVHDRKPQTTTARLPAS